MERNSFRRGVLRSQLLGALAVLLALAGIGCKEKQKPVGSSDSSLRLLTMNCQFLPWVALSDKQMPHKKRAKLIADGIKRADVDVVCLQEVFTDEAKEVLEAELKGEFPYYVWELGANVGHQDSGLMLFSKHPFVPLSKQAYLANSIVLASLATHGVAWSAGLKWTQVAYVLYLKAAGWDAMANKGAGLVRIQKGKGRFTVVFTHTQADDEEEVRKAQLEDIESMIRAVLTPKELEVEPLFVLGDLNVDGKGAPSALPDVDPEWTHRFSPSGCVGSTFMARGISAYGAKSVLADAWAHDHVDSDLGRTQGDGFEFDPANPDPGSRLDYVLWNRPTRQVVQHIRVAWELGDDDGVVYHREYPQRLLSDHLPLLVDVHESRPHASPLEPVQVWFAKNQKAFLYKDEIEEPGAVKWLHIAKPWTYSIEAESTGGDLQVGFEVYTETDLSRPMKPYDEVKSDLGWCYEISRPAFLKVFAVDSKGKPTRQTSGSFKVKVVRHDGTSPVDALNLEPLAAKNYEWPVGQLMNSEDALWFQFFTNDGVGGLPKLDFRISRNPTSVPFEVELASGANPSQTIAFDAPGSWANLGTVFSASTQTLAAPKGRTKYYLKIRRLGNVSTPVVTGAHFTTSLTYFFPTTLGCHVENDGPGDDEIWMSLTVDEQAEALKFLGDFGDNLHAVPIQEQVGVRRYVKSVAPILWEEDAGANGDSEYLEPAGGQKGWIDPLGPNTKEVASAGFKWEYLVQIYGQWIPDYTYIMRYRLSHDDR